MLCRQVDGDNKSDEVLLPRREQYYICYNLKKMINKKPSSSSDNINNITSILSSTTTPNKQKKRDNKEKVSDADKFSMSRAARLKRRNDESIKDTKLPGVKAVKIVTRR
jgi:hypothetical protein